VDVRTREVGHTSSTGWHRLLLGYVVLMLLAFLLPLPTTPMAEPEHSDKVVHFGIFLGFSLLFHTDRHWSWWWTFLVAIAFAGGIELVQALLPYRDGDWLDFAAGAAGAGLGTILALVLGQRLPGTVSRPAEKDLR
jgi:VanZ family protein